MINIAVCDDEANIRAYLACKKGRGISWGIKFDIDSELPVSMKQTKASLHGMGLANVKREVEKYMGDMKIRVRNDEFIVTVLIQERRMENEYQ